MRQVNLSRAVLGGFIATLVMTALLYLAPLAGTPKMDIAALLGSFLGHGTAPVSMSALWWAGMLWHFLNGTIIFSLIYAYFVYGWLRGDDWLRGAIWGTVLWIAMEIVIMPLRGNGVFSDHAIHAGARVLTSFIVLAVYGAILGAIAGAQAEHTFQVAHPA
ncbi:MAG TPA: DUF6789 family protein [Bryobacteraceae bacterium]|jgi:uncharacterized membrane protein YagU involved in acid resistance